MLLKILGIKPFKKIYTYRFITNKDLFADKATIVINSQILMCKNLRQLQKIFLKHSENFNEVNLATCLKKLTQIYSFDHQIKLKLTNSLISNISNKWMLFQIPNQMNKRATANLICYLANLKQFSLNQKLKQIDMQKLFSLLNPKQFVMAYVGLIKLGLFESLKKDPQQILFEYVNDKFAGGFIISIWKALILQKLENNKINNFITKLLIKKFNRINLKDFIYFLFCYNQGKDIQSKEINDLLSKYPTLYSSKPLLTPIELTIAYQNLKNIPSLLQDQQFKTILFTQHLKILKLSNLSLRNIANTYNALNNIQKPLQQIIIRTEKQLINFISNEIKYKSIDNMSLVSLFTKLLEIKSNNEQTVSKISQYFIKVGLDKLTNSEVQKLMYGFYLYKKQNNEYVMNNNLLNIILDSILKRTFEAKEIISIVNFSGSLRFRSVKFCRYCKQNFKKIQNQKKYQINQVNITQRINQKCFMSKNNTQCLQCFQKQYI